MSADNWRACPRCIFRAEAKVAVAQADHDRAVVFNYGKVSVEEYERMKGTTRKRIDEAQEDLRQLQEERSHQFREDYEFYDEGTTVYADYHGCCTVCDYTIAFKHEHVGPPLES